MSGVNTTVSALSYQICCDPSRPCRRSVESVLRLAPHADVDGADLHHQGRVRSHPAWEEKEERL